MENTAIEKRTDEKISTESQKIDELRKKVNEYEYILDQIPINVFWKNKDGVYLGCNNSVVETIGFNSKSDIIGKKDAEINWGGCEAILINNDQRVI